MREIAYAILLVTALAGRVEAQGLPVTVPEPGFTSPQCVQSAGPAVVQNAGACPGRMNVIQVTENLSLTNSECGSVLQNDNGSSQWQVTLPPSPSPNCEFTFDLGMKNFYINFNGQHGSLPGYQWAVTQWTTPVVATYRTNFPSISLQFNGAEWEQSGFSSPIFLTTMQPLNAAQLAHGQVHFAWNSSTAQFNLCQDNGRAA